MKKTSMPIPGRVVVIDDKPEQAKPLLDILHRNGISAAYFSGVIPPLPGSQF